MTAKRVFVDYMPVLSLLLYVFFDRFPGNGTIPLLAATAFSLPSLPDNSAQENNYGLPVPVLGNAFAHHARLLRQSVFQKEDCLLSYWMHMNSSSWSFCAVCLQQTGTTSPRKP